MTQQTSRAKVVVDDVDITHSRLVDLAYLADRARPFYDWVESVFRAQLATDATLPEILLEASHHEIVEGMAACYFPAQKNLPLLFDGVGRSYPHQKACYYFFAWLVRDAPQQRLGPLISRMRKNSTRSRAELEVDAIATLIVAYRSELRTFAWEAVREVVMDRLEGSRRSIKGHENEVVVRTALLAAIQAYYATRATYGEYAAVNLSRQQVKIDTETFDVCVDLMDENSKIRRRILVPVKTRETEGGGHAHLFTRDITSAIDTVRVNNPEDFVAAVIVARNWSETEAQVVRDMVDHAVIFDMSPNDFEAFTEYEKHLLNAFIASVLEGRILPKSRQ